MEFNEVNRKLIRGRLVGLNILFEIFNYIFLCRYFNIFIYIIFRRKIIIKLFYLCARRAQ